MPGMPLFAKIWIRENDNCLTFPFHPDDSSCPDSVSTSTEPPSMQDSPSSSQSTEGAVDLRTTRHSHQPTSAIPLYLTLARSGGFTGTFKDFLSRVEEVGVLLRHYTFNDIAPSGEILTRLLHDLPNPEFLPEFNPQLWQSNVYPCLTYRLP